MEEDACLMWVTEIEQRSKRLEPRDIASRVSAASLLILGLERGMLTDVRLVYISSNPIATSYYLTSIVT